MELEFECEKGSIVFDVEFRKRKTLEIKVEPQGHVRVLAPYFLSSREVMNAVKKKSSWILEKIEYMKKIKLPLKELKDGEKLMYLGEEYPLKIVIDKSLKKAKAGFYEGRICAFVKSYDKDEIKMVLIIWYKKMAEENIKYRAEYFQKFFSVKPKEIKVKEQKRRWGSCTYDNRLLFNWRCIMARQSAIDSIVVHEMCHMCQKNHSNDFWNLVFGIFPEYKKENEWLKINSMRMDL